MVLLLTVFLRLAADEALAGAAYKEAIEAVRRGQYEEAVGRLQEALRNEPRETEKLIYRDREGRHKEPYYPHYVWSQALAQQARNETILARRRQLLREALTHLELTQHPGAPAMLASVKSDLAEVEKTSATPVTADASIAALRRRIETLCNEEKFVEAARAAASEKALLERFPAERSSLLGTIESHRSAVVTRYGKTLDLALETVAATSVLEKPESLPNLLQPALLPATVSENPERRFVWLREFLAAYQEALPMIRRLGAADPAAVLSCARAFEKSAMQALAAGTYSGFRASLSVAHAVRLQTLSGARDDALLESLLVDAEQALRDCDRRLSAEPGLAKDRDGLLKPHAACLKDIREKLRDRTRLRDDLEEWVRRAEAALADPARMSNPEALGSIAKEFSSLEGRKAWSEAPAGLRARVLFSQALLEVVVGFLEGAPFPQAGPRIKGARSLDPSVESRWKDLLSPKIKTWLDQMDR